MLNCIDLRCKPFSLESYCAFLSALKTCDGIYMHEKDRLSQPANVLRANWDETKNDGIYISHTLDIFSTVDRCSGAPNISEELCA